MRQCLRLGPNTGAIESPLCLLLDFDTSPPRRRTQKGAAVTAQSYAIEVFGQSFKVTSEKSEQHVRTVATYVDRKMRERARVNKTIMPLGWRLWPR